MSEMPLDKKTGLILNIFSQNLFSISKFLTNIQDL